MSEIIYTTSSAPYHDAGRVLSYVLDSAYGADENNYSLFVIDDVTLPEGTLWYIDGTEFGGVVDSTSSIQEHRTSRRNYAGRTWQGILANKVIEPPSGASHYTFSGDANDVISDVIDYVGLNGLFKASTSQSGTISGQFDRYTDAYSGLNKALRTNGLRLSFSWNDGKVLLAAVPLVVYENTVDSDLVSFDITKTFTNVNHLVCLGAGELQNRLVRHVYADVFGNVSTTQTIFGDKEVAQVYECSNVDDSEELVQNGIDQLQSMQGDGEVSVSIAPMIEFYINDVIVAQDNDFGITVTAHVIKKIINSNGGVTSITYEVGTPDNNNGGF